jgi:hypothetical protein
MRILKFLKETNNITFEVARARGKSSGKEMMVLKPVYPKGITGLAELASVEKPEDWESFDKILFHFIICALDNNNKINKELLNSVTADSTLTLSQSAIFKLLKPELFQTADVASIESLRISFYTQLTSEIEENLNNNQGDGYLYLLMLVSAKNLYDRLQNDALDSKSVVGPAPTATYGNDLSAIDLTSGSDKNKDKGKGKSKGKSSDNASEKDGTDSAGSTPRNDMEKVKVTLDSPPVIKNRPSEMLVDQQSISLNSKNLGTKQRTSKSNVYADHQDFIKNFFDEVSVAITDTDALVKKAFQDYNSELKTFAGKIAQLSTVATQEHVDVPALLAEIHASYAQVLKKLNTVKTAIQASKGDYLTTWANQDLFDFYDELENDILGDAHQRTLAQATLQIVANYPHLNWSFFTDNDQKKNFSLSTILRAEAAKHDQLDIKISVTNGYSHWNKLTNQGKHQQSEWFYASKSSNRYFINNFFNDCKDIVDENGREAVRAAYKAYKAAADDLASKISVLNKNDLSSKDVTENIDSISKAFQSSNDKMKKFNDAIASSKTQLYFFNGDLIDFYQDLQEGVAHHQETIQNVAGVIITHGKILENSNADAYKASLIKNPMMNSLIDKNVIPDAIKKSFAIANYVRYLKQGDLEFPFPANLSPDEKELLRQDLTKWMFASVDNDTLAPARQRILMALFKNDLVYTDFEKPSDVNRANVIANDLKSVAELVTREALSNSGTFYKSNKLILEKMLIVANDVHETVKLNDTLTRCISSLDEMENAVQKSHRVLTSHLMASKMDCLIVATGLCVSHTHAGENNFEKVKGTHEKNASWTNIESLYNSLNEFLNSSESSAANVLARIDELYNSENKMQGYAALAEALSESLAEIYSTQSKMLLQALINKVADEVQALIAKNNILLADKETYKESILERLEFLRKHNNALYNQHSALDQADGQPLRNAVFVEIKSKLSVNIKTQPNIVQFNDWVLRKEGQNIKSAMSNARNNDPELYKKYRELLKVCALNDAQGYATRFLQEFPELTAPSCVDKVREIAQLSAAQDPTSSLEKLKQEIKRDDQSIANYLDALEVNVCFQLACGQSEQNLKNALLVLKMLKYDNKDIASLVSSSIATKSAINKDLMEILKHDLYNIYDYVETHYNANKLANFKSVVTKFSNWIYQDELAFIVNQPEKLCLRLKELKDNGSITADEYKFFTTNNGQISPRALTLFSCAVTINQTLKQLFYVTDKNIRSALFEYLAGIKIIEGFLAIHSDVFGTEQDDSFRALFKGDGVTENLFFSNEPHDKYLRKSASNTQSIETLPILVRAKKIEDILSKSDVNDSSLADKVKVMNNAISSSNTTSTLISSSSSTTSSSANSALSPVAVPDFILAM